MTISILNAVRQMVRALPDRYDALALRLNKHPDTLRHEIAGAPGYKLGAEDFEEITMFCLEAKLDNALIGLTTLNANCGQMTVPLPTVEESGDGMEVMKQLGETAREFSDLCHEVSKDVKDGKITDTELRKFDKEASELIASIHNLRNTLGKMNAAQKPKRGAL